VEGDDSVRERTVVMKLTVMTSWINARAISFVGTGGSCERDADREGRECQGGKAMSEQNGRSLKLERDRGNWKEGGKQRKSMCLKFIIHLLIYLLGHRWYVFFYSFFFYLR